ncbi:hypothetical protein [uncultured Agathobaculum sp.]|uniref:hypothetical protein n=1 Tax=uncultured Agathobaculum sp. TaxID=2048140 RepID=UPI00320B95C6
MQLEVKGKTFSLSSASERQELMQEHRRKVLTLDITGTFAEVSEVLTDGAVLVIVDDEGHEYTHDGYPVPGPLTDNRDGTITAKMGAANTVEQDLQDEVTSKTKIITAIAGKTVQTTEEAAAVRADVESLFVASTMDDDGKIRASYLCKEWKPGKYEVGDVYNAIGQTWEVHQSYDNSANPDIVPGDKSWPVFNRPLHGKSPETTRPWVKPEHGTTDMYHAGEYMIYTDGALYKCLQDTNFSPDEYAQAWEKQEG